MTTPLDKTIQCPTEYTIKVKDDTSSLSEKHITYEPLILAIDNAELASKVSEVYKKFNKGLEWQESPEITIRAKMVWQP